MGQDNVHPAGKTGNDLDSLSREILVTTILIKESYPGLQRNYALFIQAALMKIKLCLYHVFVRMMYLALPYMGKTFVHLC